MLLRVIVAFGGLEVREEGGLVGKAGSVGGEEDEQGCNGWSDRSNRHDDETVLRFCEVLMKGV